MQGSESMEKHIGGRMEKKPKLVGRKAGARSTVRQQMILVFLDHKFHRPPTAIDPLIDEAAVPVLQVSDDKTGVHPDSVGLDLGDDSAGLLPGLGFIESLDERSHRLLLLLKPQGRLLEKGLDLSEKRRERLKPQNIFHVVFLTKVKNLRTRVIGISTQHEADLRPSLSDSLNHSFEDRDDLPACRALSRPQHGGYQSAALPFIDVDGQIAVVTMIGIEKTQLLMAIGQIIGIIYIQNDRFWRFLIRFNKNIQKHLGYPVKICPGKTVLKPANGRLTGQRLFLRQPFAGYFHYWVFSQLITVVAILITAGNLENPLPEKLEKLVFDITGMTPVSQGISHFTDQTYPLFNLPQEKHSSIGADLSAVEISFNFFSRNTFKKEQLFGTIFHGCFLVFFVLTYYISIRYERKQLFL